MFETMTQIGNRYGITARAVGEILYTLKIRDAEHPDRKGFPYEQAVVHGIAKAYTGKNGETYYRYDIARIREEFEQALSDKAVAEAKVAKMETEKPRLQGGTQAFQNTLSEMLDTLNAVLAGGDCSMLYRLKANIADLYAQCGKTTS